MLSCAGSRARGLGIEDIQDQVELGLMRSGEHDVARAYALYREERRACGRSRKPRRRPRQSRSHQRDRRGVAQPLDVGRLQGLVRDSCEGLGRSVYPGLILQSIYKDLYDGVPMEQVRKCATLWGGL